MFDKLKFWKKEDEFDLDSVANKDFSKEFGPTPGLPGDTQGTDQKPFGMEEKSPFGEDFTKPSQTSFTTPDVGFPGAARSGGGANINQQPQPNSWQNSQPLSLQNREVELLNSKLDTLKAMLQSIDQRLNEMERTNMSDKQKQRLW